jgi:hypothetical protein
LRGVIYEASTTPKKKIKTAQVLFYFSPEPGGGQAQMMS